MSVNRLLHVGVVAVASFGVLSACGTDPAPAASSGGGASSIADCPEGTLNAEGSSAQKNAIEEVISQYTEKCADVTVNYNPTGSGAGIKQFTAGQVDFAGSDSALRTEARDGVVEAEAAAKRCAGNPALNLPMVIGPVALAYNLDGVDGLVLDGPTAAKIFQGTVTTWNAPEIAALNPGANLPGAPIAVFFRSDESGTTENVTKYLAASGGGAWKGLPGKKWTGTGAGREKSAGVAEGVKSTKNSLSYVEWSYAVDNKLGVARIDTGSGPVELTADSASKAVAAAKPARGGSDLALKLDYATRTPGAYPIILVTYEIACSAGLPAEKTALVKSFLSHYAGTEAQAVLGDLNYAPLPQQLRAKVEAAIEGIN